jgi:pilus assembly protein Flp/PilA
MTQLFVRFLNDQSGATAIEYGLIAALIAVVAISTLTTVGSKLNAKFSKISNGLTERVNDNETAGLII